MPRIKARYPLLLCLLIGSIYLLSTTPVLPSAPSKIQPIPNLDAGYYLVLHTNAKLPPEIEAQHSKNMTYVGPLPTIAECHNSRNKIKPLYPGITLDLIKVNQT